MENIEHNFVFSHSLMDNNYPNLLQTLTEGEDQSFWSFSGSTL